MPHHAVTTPDTAFEGYYGTPRHALIDLLEGPPPVQVLEIGCGSGANLAEIKRRYPGCHTTGVELQAEAATAAKARPGVDLLLHGDVRDPASVRFEPGHFDLVVLSHVLEHFAEPEWVLAQCCQWLRPGGRALVALPNLRHAVVIKQLVVDGDFRYADAGILDRTHLRFYTRASALRLLAGQGLQVVKARADIEGRRSHWLDVLSLGLAREFAAFAYNFLAVKA